MDEQEKTITSQFKPYLDSMPSSPLKSYITERIIAQIAWYDKKSIEKQDWFNALTIATIILNAVIPAIILFSDCGLIFKLFATCLSSSSGAISTIIALGDYKDLWVQYRSNCELLQSTLHLFFLRAGEFSQIKDDEEALLDALVFRCEDYLTKEFQTWVTVTIGEQQATTTKS